MITKHDLIALEGWQSNLILDVTRLHPKVELGLESKVLTLKAPCRADLFQLAADLSQRLDARRFTMGVRQVWGSVGASGFTPFNYVITLDFSGLQWLGPACESPDLNLSWVCKADSPVPDYCLFDQAKAHGLYDVFNSYTWLPMGVTLNLLKTVSSEKLEPLFPDAHIPKPKGKQMRIEFNRMLPNLPEQYRN